VTVVEIVSNSDSNAYENVDISEGHDICEVDESHPVVFERSSSDSSSEEIVLQTQQDRSWKRMCNTKSKRVISDCELR
jgi:hypothetical protein